MPFIDDKSLEELKAKVWDEGYHAGVRSEYATGPEDDAANFNPYAKADEFTNPTFTLELYHKYAYLNYCPEGGCNED